MLKVLHASFGHWLKCEYCLSEIRTFLYYLYDETYESMSSAFFSLVVKSRFLGIEVAILKPLINVSG